MDIFGIYYSLKPINRKEMYTIELKTAMLKATQTLITLIEDETRVKFDEESESELAVILSSAKKLEKEVNNIKPININ